MSEFKRGDEVRVNLVGWDGEHEYVAPMNWAPGQHGILGPDGILHSVHESNFTRLLTDEEIASEVAVRWCEGEWVTIESVVRAAFCMRDERDKEPKHV